MHDITLGPYTIGDGKKPVFVAEIGAMFNQDLGLALRLVEQVAAARDAVAGLPLALKSEILHDPSCCLDDESTVSYQSKTGEIKTERYRDLIERKALPLEAYARIFARCRELGLPMIMSVYDKVGAEFAVAEGVCALKTNSGNITNRPHLRNVAHCGLPMLIDTGGSSFDEVKTAVELVGREGNADVIVQHSPDGHPAKPEDHNLRSLITLREKLDVQVGLSCHSRGVDSLIMSLGLGASLLEKNIVMDDGLLEQDYAIAEPVAKLEEILRRVDVAWRTLGAAFRAPEMAGKRTRYGLVALVDLRSGDVLDENNAGTAFPCRGIPAAHYDEAIGGTVRRAVQAGKPIDWSDLDAPAQPQEGA